MCNTFHSCQPSVNLKRSPIRNLKDDQQAGTREKCYASRPLGRDFDFLRRLAPGRLDEFLIEKYEKKRESFGHCPANFQSGAMRFSSDGAVPEKKNSFYPYPSIERRSKSSSLWTFLCPILLEGTTSQFLSFIPLIPQN